MSDKLPERVATLEQSDKTKTKQIDTLCTDVKEIKEKLLGRPSWFVIMIIAGLSSICSSLISYILTKAL
jgi:hypothetical protein